MSSRKPFGLATNFDKIDEINNPDKYKIFAYRKTGYTYKTYVTKGKEIVADYKVLLPKAAEGSGVFPNNILTEPFTIGPNEICTETYIVVNHFKTEDEAKNLESYIKTRFFRFLVSLRKVTQDATSKVYGFVPDLNMHEKWTDEKLYERYGITNEEQDFINSLIKEMK